jgi:hypothetical protein
MTSDLDIETFPEENNTSDTAANNAQVCGQPESSAETGE